MAYLIKAAIVSSLKTERQVMFMVISHSLWMSAQEYYVVGPTIPKTREMILFLRLSSGLLLYLLLLSPDTEP